MSLIDVETLVAADPDPGDQADARRGAGRDERHFGDRHAADGAPSIPSESLLKGKVVQPRYMVRLDRQRCVRMPTDPMFRRLMDLPLDAAMFGASTCSTSRSRLLTHEVADLLFSEVVELARWQCRMPEMRGARLRQLGWKI